MNKKLMTFWIIASMVLALLAAPFSHTNVQETAAVDVSQISVFQAKKFDAHYRVPRESDVERLLVENMVMPVNATPEQRDAAVKQFMDGFNARNPDTPNPDKLRQLLEREKSGMMRDSMAVVPPSKILVVPVEFPDEPIEIEFCEDDPDQGLIELTGPLHNEIPAPGLRDNNTIWYDDTTPDLYDELYFGVGPDAGVIVDHPNLGLVDLKGHTMANYYLQQSEGAFTPGGVVYPKWLMASKAEAYYGQNGCTSGSHNINARELVVEVLNAVKADDPDFDWQQFDNTGPANVPDGIVDNFTVIHAGMGEEAGGGAQGEGAIWAHASTINWPHGYKVCTAGDTGCPDRDIYVLDYSMDPENVDIGVISEEFGHAAFGLPDMYSNYGQGAISNWAIMESGSWNGILGGMEPAPFPLWFRYLIGWSHPVEMDYDDPASETIVGQHSLRPDGTAQGIKINLPSVDVSIPNPLGTGQAFWSTSNDEMTNALVHEFDLTTATNPVFSFESDWQIEEDWDGGFVQVSTDDGATWTSLDDTGNFFTLTDLNDNLLAADYALTGAGEGTLSFNLSDYAGQTIKLRLYYFTDLAVSEPGWWADDFSLDDGADNLFADDVETGFGAWLSSTWEVVPFTDTFERYYLVEWRNLSGFDHGLLYPYHTLYIDDDEWRVDRAPYSVPGMLLFYRDATFMLDYDLSNNLEDSPSWGPKHGIALIDSHWKPRTWNKQYYTSGQEVRLSDRIQPGDGSFSLTPTSSYRLRYTNAAGDVLETKTFEARDPVPAFNDSFGYYPGVWFRPQDGGLYYWNAYASGVVPAKDNYTTRITWDDDTPAYDFYGADMGTTILGSGNPGEADVEYGVNVEVLEQAADGTWGKIKVWNEPTDVAASVNSSTPDLDEIEVLVDADIILTFSEDVNVDADMIDLSCDVSGDHTFTLTGSGQVFTLDPDTDFVKNEDCGLWIVPDAVTDADTVDPFDSMPMPFWLSFHTDADYQYLPGIFNSQP